MNTIIIIIDYHYHYCYRKAPQSAKYSERIIRASEPGYTRDSKKVPLPSSMYLSQLSFVRIIRFMPLEAKLSGH